jgi:anterior pharynx defective protein 1
LISVSGLGFGIISGTFSLVNVLADATGPGTVGLHGDSNLFFLTSALTTLCFILLHTAWGVLFFHALDKKKYLALVWVVMSHLLVSLLVIIFLSSSVNEKSRSTWFSDSA